MEWVDVLSNPKWSGSARIASEPTAAKKNFLMTHCYISNIDSRHYLWFNFKQLEIALIFKVLRGHITHLPVRNTRQETSEIWITFRSQFPASLLFTAISAIERQYECASFEMVTSTMEASAFQYPSPDIATSTPYSKISTRRYSVTKLDCQWVFATSLVSTGKRSNLSQTWRTEEIMFAAATISSYLWIIFATLLIQSGRQAQKK